MIFDYVSAVTKSLDCEECKEILRSIGHLHPYTHHLNIENDFLFEKVVDNLKAAEYNDYVIMLELVSKVK